MQRLYSQLGFAVQQLAGWLEGSAQPLDSATCMSACMSRWTCISSALLGSSFRRALAYSVRLTRVPSCARK